MAQQPDRHEYEAHHENGDIFTVTTGHHHDDHTVENFKKILADIIKNSTSGAIGGVVSGLVLRYVYKGKVPPPKPPRG